MFLDYWKKQMQINLGKMQLQFRLTGIMSPDVRDVKM